MSNTAIQAQWNLGTAFSAARGFMIAATSDNVQALALLACYEFGGTLAMSIETTNKVECILVPSPQPALISFLKANVGFFPNDCATQLGQSNSGLRFLALAAALVTSLGPFESAKSLDLMLKRTTNDLTALPTVRNLKDLLGSLEARSHRCGFADSVVGWQILLRKEVLPFILAEETRQRLSRSSLQKVESALLDSTPSPEAIAGLVDVFRELARVGSATILGATIRIGAAAPWVLAFAHWCVGPASLYVGGKQVLEQPGSRLKVVISSAADDIGKPFDVTIHHQVENITRLLGPPSQTLTTGMVTIESYRTWLLQELGFGDEMTQRVLREALQHAIPQVLRKSECGEFTCLGQDANAGLWFSSDIRDRCCLSPLPDIRAIANISATVLGLDNPMQFASPDGSILVADTPLVLLHLRALAEKCRAEQCGVCTGNSKRPGSNLSWCRKHKFFRSLSFIVMDILALSLFDSPSPLLVRLSRDRKAGFDMEEHVTGILKTGNPGVYDDMELLGWARNLVGHMFDDEDRGLIATSSGGQVIYPNVLDTFHVEKQGYLRLCCLPGVLKYQDDTYDVVSYPDSGVDKRDVDQHAYGDLPPVPKRVSGPLNLFKEFGLSWSISVQDNREMHARVILRAKANSLPLIEVDPLMILLSLRDTLMIETCSHDRRAPLKSPDRFASYTSPWDEHDDAVDSTSTVDVVAVDGADDLRCLAIACAHTGTHIALRRNSCLACCLDVCRETDVHVLVL